MKVAVISANMGGFEKNIVPYAPQSVPYDFYSFDDESFTPRKYAMSPRLQARIPKMFAWQLAPDYDVYIWVDSSCALQDPNSVKWFLSQLEPHEADIHAAFFKHPNRNTIHEEADYLNDRLLLEPGKPIEDQYITSRYKYEDIAGMIKEIEADRQFVDDKLFATTAFVYRNHKKARHLLKEWWYYTSRYHIIDQLGLPYAIDKARANIRIIPDNYTKSPYIQYTRNLPKTT